jgi:hypothetical protein
LLRGDEVDTAECGPCGGECTVSGQRRALFADVHLPAPSGGQGVYRGVLRFSDSEPARVSTRDPTSIEGEVHEVQATQFVKLEAGEAMTMHQEVSAEDFSYAGCFTFAVWDPAGNVAQTSGCLPTLSPDDVRSLARGDAPALSCALGARAPTVKGATLVAWLTPLLFSCLVRRTSRRRASRRQD